MAGTQLTDWIDAKAKARGTTASAVAARAGVNKATVSKWRTGQSPDPDMVRRIASALDAPVLEAFIAAGFLDRSDTTKVIELPRALADLDATELTDELHRRLDLAEAQSAFIDALTQGAAVWIGEAPHSPGVSVTREGDRVTANLVLSPNNELRIHPALAARTRGETSDFTQEPAATGSEGEADSHENSRAGGARNVVTLNLGDQVPKPERPEDAKAARKRDPRFPPQDPDAQ